MTNALSGLRSDGTEWWLLIAAARRWAALIWCMVFPFSGGLVVVECRGVGLQHLLTVRRVEDTHHALVHFLRQVCPVDPLEGLVLIVDDRQKLFGNQGQ